MVPWPSGEWSGVGGAEFVGLDEEAKFVGFTKPGRERLHEKKNIYLW